MIRNVLVQAAKQMQLDMPEEQIQAFELFAQELKKWNRKINLTSIVADQDIAIKHIIDSLCLTRLVPVAATVLDMGSGAGIPALPLKIARPDLSIVSVDAVGKKVHFQRHMARLLQLQDFMALHSRIEDLHTSHALHFDLITSRAFSDLGMFVRLAEPLLAIDGCVIAMKGPAAGSELHAADADLHTLQFEISSIERYTLPHNSGERCLIAMKRNNKTSASGQTSAKM